MIASYDVVARGFEIRNVSSIPKTILTISEYTSNPKKSPVLFQDNEDVEVLEEEDNDVTFDLSFQYAGFSFHYDSFAHASSVHMEKKVTTIFSTRLKGISRSKASMCAL